MCILPSLAYTHRKPALRNILLLRGNLASLPESQPPVCPPNHKASVDHEKYPTGSWFSKRMIQSRFI